MAGGGGGSVDVNLQRALENAGKVAEMCAQGMITKGQPAFNNYANPGEPGPDRFDREMKEVFDFENIINEFSSSDENTTGGGAAFMQCQYAMFAQMVRDQRLRKRTRIAQMAHGAVRLKAINKSMNGPALARIMMWIEAGDAK